MTRGYLLFANNLNIDGHRQYTKLAYACALSIKITQPKNYNNVSVVTNSSKSFDNYLKIFDHIIECSDSVGMDARSRAYDLTPYDETVMLDADMLFLQPMDHYWHMMNKRDLFVCTAPQTYRGKTFHYGYYRKVFQQHKWPDVYNAWTYFKKPSQLCEEFFGLVKIITDNPQSYINLFLSETLYTTMPTDEAFALAMYILDNEHAICPDWDFPRITHMKPAVQQWRESVADWTDTLRFNMDTSGQVKIGVWQQADLLHYVKKELITAEVINRLEQAL